MRSFLYSDLCVLFVGMFDPDCPASESQELSGAQAGSRGDSGEHFCHMLR